jgi:hypothetical protein
MVHSDEEMGAAASMILTPISCRRRRRRRFSQSVGVAETNLGFDSDKGLKLDGRTEGRCSFGFGFRQTEGLSDVFN